VRSGSLSDEALPGIGAVTNYLKDSLPRAGQVRAGEYWQGSQREPGLHAEGRGTERARRPADDDSGASDDVINAHNIRGSLWRRVQCRRQGQSATTGAMQTICNPFEYESNYPTVVDDHQRDVTDLYGYWNGTLPAVVLVKRTETMEGHPASRNGRGSRPSWQNIVRTSQEQQETMGETEIFVTVEEGGGYTIRDSSSRLISSAQGPSIPMIAVSPFTREATVSHVYNEHSSFVKFVERTGNSVAR